MLYNLFEGVLGVAGQHDEGVLELYSTVSMC